VKQYLFSYGTLQKEEVQLELFGRKLKGFADVLRGYKLAAIEIRDEIFLSKGEENIQRTLVASDDVNDIVQGTVLELTEEELQQADKYEPDNYKRRQVQLDSGKQAWVYVANHGLKTPD
jgi:gamma-glutamylcyclotransferase (GGCT)/AIG2-like uncharacterized protein YtfP